MTTSPHPPGTARTAACMAVAASLVVVLVVLRTPQGIFPDPTAQLKALQQFVAGQSPSFNTWVTPDPQDMSREWYHWMSHWPPGMGLLLYPLVAAGLSLATAVRILAAASLIIGSIGWAAWFSRFRMPRAMLFCLSVAVPWVHYANLPLFQYSTEGLNYAIGPWLLFAAVRAVEHWSVRGGLLRLAFLGGLMGAAYWCKYSSVFVSLGILLFLGFTIHGEWNIPVARRFGALAAAVTPFAVLGLALTACNLAYSQTSEFHGSSASLAFHWHNLTDPLAMFPLAMTDLKGLLDYLLLHPGRPVLRSDTLIYLAALPVGLLLAWLVWRRANAGNAAWLARCTMLASWAGLFAAWTGSFGDASHEARHVAIAGMALVPLAIQEGMLLRPKMRLVVAAVGAVVVALPMAYGAVAVFGKLGRVPANYRAGISGFYSSTSLVGDEQGYIAALARDFSPATDVWYVLDSVTALDLPGRVIIADRIPIALLRKRQYLSSNPIRVRLVLPAFWEQTGDGAVTRGMFSQARLWKAIPVENSDSILWTAQLQ